MKLYEISCGSVKIEKINADGKNAKRLEEMGICKGKCVSVENFKKSRVTLIGINGWTLAVNRPLASLIEVSI